MRFDQFPYTLPVVQRTARPNKSHRKMAPHIEHKSDGVFRILSLDGGGSKGFYTLGVLHEIEGLLQCPLHKRFDLVYGTSTGAIIAALIALGHTVEEIHQYYRKYVPAIMKQSSASGKSIALANLSVDVFGKASFEEVKTGIGIVSTKWVTEQPMIFKANVNQAFGRKSTFLPGFGVPIGEAVQASCSAYPFFNRKTVTTGSGASFELIDGGFCANNPALYAITDALVALGKERQDIRIVSVGVGSYPPVTLSPIRSPKKWLVQQLTSVKLLQKTLEINTHSMDQLRSLLFQDIPTVRINETFERPEMATDFLEYDLSKLNVLRTRGMDSYGKFEAALRASLL